MRFYLCLGHRGGNVTWPVHLVNGLSILECFSSAFHDLCQVMHDVAGIQVTDSPDLTFTFSNSLKNYCLFGVTKHREIGVMRCKDHLATELYAGQNVDYYLTDKAIIHVVFGLYQLEEDLCL